MTIDHDAPSDAAQTPVRLLDAVTAPPDPIELIRNVLTKAAEFIGAPHGFIAHLTPDDHELTVRLGLGAFDRPASDILGPIGELAVDAWRGGCPVVVRRRDMPAGEARFHELAFVPFEVGPRVGGLVGLAYGADSVLSFRAAEIDLISGFCRLASIALDNARLYAEEKRSRRLTERLQDSVRAINQSLDLDVVLPAILDQLREVIEYDSSTCNFSRRCHAGDRGPRFSA